MCQETFLAPAVKGRRTRRDCFSWRCTGTSTSGGSVSPYPGPCHSSTDELSLRWNLSLSRTWVRCRGKERPSGPSRAASCWGFRKGGAVARAPGWPGSCGQAALKAFPWEGTPWRDSLCHQFPFKKENTHVAIPFHPVSSSSDRSLRTTYRARVSNPHFFPPSAPVLSFHSFEA